MQRRKVVHLSVDIEVLPSDHPERRLGQLAGHGCGRIGGRLAKRLGQQGIARENGVGFAEAGPRARPPAPYIVVVQSRQVIVYERERVDELQRRRRRQEVLHGCAGRLTRRQADHGPHALASRLEPVANGRGEVTQLGNELQARQVLLDELAELIGRLH